MGYKGKKKKDLAQCSRDTGGRTEQAARCDTGGSEAATDFTLRTPLSQRSWAQPTTHRAQQVPSIPHPAPFVCSGHHCTVGAAHDTGPRSTAQGGDALSLTYLLSVSRISNTIASMFLLPSFLEGSLTFLTFPHLQPFLTALAKKAMLKPPNVCSTVLMNKCHCPHKCE